MIILFIFTSYAHGLNVLGNEEHLEIVKKPPFMAKIILNKD